MQTLFILNWKQKLVAAVGMVSGIVASVAYAQDAPLVTSLSALQDKLCMAFRWIYTFAIIIGVVYIVVAAIKYMTASGDPEKVKSAHKALTFAIIGIAIAILAYGVPFIIASFLGAGSVSSACGV
jgi:heme/copper-type cytochrome/quinol oxidase subunit 2